MAERQVKLPTGFTLESGLPPGFVLEDNHSSGAGNKFSQFPPKVQARIAYEAVKGVTKPIAESAPEVFGSMLGTAIEGVPGIVASSAGAATGEAIRQQAFGDKEDRIKKIGKAAVRGAVPEIAIRGLKAAAPALKSGGKWILNQAEKVSGLNYKNKGILTEVVEDPSLFFSSADKGNASAAYEAAKTPGSIRPEMKALTSKMQMVRKAAKAVENGSITPEEALEARKTLTEIKNNIPTEAYRQHLEAFDQIAKEKFALPDLLHSRASKTEALRDIIPMNKGGTPSRLMEAGMIGLGIGSRWFPGAAAAIPFISPAGQGLTAALIGTGAKVAKKTINPASLRAIINAALQKTDKK